MPDDNTAYKQLHPDGRLIIPLDIVRGAAFAVASVLSGAVASNNLPPLSGGGRVYAIVTSSIVKARPLSIELWNKEAQWLEVEFRDGGTNGGRVLGPYNLLPRTGMSVPRENLYGRYFTSSIHLQILSGPIAQPLSNGVLVNVSYVLDPQAPAFNE